MHSVPIGRVLDEHSRAHLYSGPHEELVFILVGSRGGAIA